MDVRAARPQVWIRARSERRNFLIGIEIGQERHLGKVEASTRRLMPTSTSNSASVISAGSPRADRINIAVQVSHADVCC